MPDIGPGDAGSADAGDAGPVCVDADGDGVVDTNPGTRAMPVATIRQGMVNAITIGMGVDVFVAAGTYAEDIMMAGVTFPAGTTHITAIDGFTIDAGIGGGSGTGITIMADSSPEVRGNVINGLQHADAGDHHRWQHRPRYWDRRRRLRHCRLLRRRGLLDGALHRQLGGPSLRGPLEGLIAGSGAR